MVYGVPIFYWHNIRDSKSMECIVILKFITCPSNSNKAFKKNKCIFVKWSYIIFKGLALKLITLSWFIKRNTVYNIVYNNYNKISNLPLINKN